MEPKEKYLEILITFLPHMYCYRGSGMLSNTYDKDVASRHAKECTMYHIEQMIEQWDLLHTIDPTPFIEKQLKYWYEVKKVAHENYSN